MIQNLIDELRKALPGRVINLRFGTDSGSIEVIPNKAGDVYASIIWGASGHYKTKTPDEALQLLRQRLGLEGEKK